MTENLLDLYMANAHRVDGIPPPDDIAEEDFPYIRCLGKPFRDGVTWEAFRAEIDREQQYLASQSDPRLPIYPDEERKGWRAFSIPVDIQPTLTALCQDVSMGDAPGVSAVYRNMTSRLARWYDLPKAGVEEKNAEFAFYRLRCVLGGAGYANWGILARMVCAQVDGCPFGPDETKEQWHTALVEAHRACGWPTTVLWLDWAEIPDWDSEEIPDWLRAAALAHLLKHVRCADEHIHVCYRGVIEYIPHRIRIHRSVGSTAFWTAAAACLRRPDGKHSVKRRALGWAANSLGTDDLLRCSPLTELPGTVLAGPWSTLLPMVSDGRPGFLNPGVRVSGAWKASGGRITPFEGDEGDVLHYSWNTGTAADFARQRQLFEHALPSFHEQTSPSEVLLSAYPHWVLPTGDDRAGYTAMVDSILCASVLRSSRPDLLREYPLLAVLPVYPSAELTTNQGKGLMVGALAGAMAPGIPVLTAPNSTSAPDSRSVATELSRWGTLALDEFRIPEAPAHVLSRDNLQSLCTGGVVASGKAMQNEGTVQLRHSLVLNAKWLDLSPDLRNRTIPIFLDALPDAQRSRIDVKESLESGRFALLLRLAAVSQVERLGLMDQTKQTKASSNAWRFTSHRAIAARIAGGALEDDTRATYVIDDVRLSMDKDLEYHQQLADQTGVSAQSNSGQNVRLSWHAFWSGADDTMITNLTVGATQEGTDIGGTRWMSVSLLCKLRLDGIIPGCASFHRLLPALTGQEVRVSNLAVGRAITLSIRAFYADSLAARQVVWADLPGDGAGWEAAVRPRAWDGDSASAQTLMVAVRQKVTPCHLRMKPKL